MSTTVNIHYAKTHLSALLAKVSAGEEVIIAKSGKPMARLVTTAQPRPRVPGRFAGQIEIPPAFYEPLTEEELDEIDNGPPGDPLRASMTLPSRT